MKASVKKQDWRLPSFYRRMLYEKKSHSLFFYEKSDIYIIARVDYQFRGNADVNVQTTG